MINFFKALADHTRLRILALLDFGELTVQELTHVLNLGQSTISHNLKVLIDAQILRVRRQGTWGYYRLNFENKIFSDIFPCMQGLLKEDPQYMADSVRVLDLFEEHRRSTRRFFDREAPQWDRVARNLLPLPPYLQSFLETVPAVSLGVEVGCGTGNLLERLRRKAAFLIGVDQSPEMIEEAQKKVQSDNLQGVELRLGDMMHLPLESNQVDLVIMNMALHHAAQPLQALREVSRVLRKGGHFLVADMLPHDREWVRVKLADQWLGFSRTDLQEWLTACGMAIQSWQEIEGQGREMDVFFLKGEKLANKTKGHNMSLFEE